MLSGRRAGHSGCNGRLARRKILYFHYEIATTEDSNTWTAFFDGLIERGLDPNAVKLLVSDGTKGLLATMKERLPQASQQRCITHKVRGMKPYLAYNQLPDEDEAGQALSKSEAKKQAGNLSKMMLTTSTRQKLVQKQNSY